jgi:hypothetical protein
LNLNPQEEIVQQKENKFHHQHSFFGEDIEERDCIFAAVAKS